MASHSGSAGTSPCSHAPRPMTHLLLSMCRQAGALAEHPLWKTTSSVRTAAVALRLLLTGDSAGAGKQQQAGRQAGGQGAAAEAVGGEEAQACSWGNFNADQ